MKYVVLEVTFGKGKSSVVREMPFIFPEMYIHSDFAAHMENMILAADPALEVKPVAAGFISSMDCCMKYSCAGKSDTLGLASRDQQDSELIRMHDYLHGVV